MELRFISDAVRILMDQPQIHTVTVFCSPLSDVKERVRVTRIGKRNLDFRVKIGKPNYAEREFLKLCKEAKTAPKKFWLKPYPKKRK